MRLYLQSTVKGREGPCVPTWLNRNRVERRLYGGISGFFKRVVTLFGVPIYKTGPEFHGIIRDGITVQTTEIKIV